MRVLPTKWRRNPAGVDMERNYVTVTLCIQYVKQTSPMFAVLCFSSDEKRTKKKNWFNIIIIIIIKHIYIAQVRKGHRCAMSAEMAVRLRNCLCLYSYLHNKLSRQLNGSVFSCLLEVSSVTDRRRDEHAVQLVVSSKSVFFNAIRKRTAAMRLSATSTVATDY